MNIDAHQHFWRIDRGDYGWLTPEAGPIYRDFLPADLAPILSDEGIEGTVLIQAAPTRAETQFLLKLAAQHAFVLGVVGWADFDAPDAGARIELMAGERKLVGLRPMIQDMADDQWMLRPGLQPAFAAMERLGLAFDALVRPRHLPFLLRFAQRHAGLRIVIDHGAKPDIAGGAFGAWAAAIRPFASLPHVHCKLSGLITEAGPKVSENDIAPYVNVLLQTFGARRLMWGSDWPVLNLNGEYGRWRGMARAALRHVGDDDLANIFGGTAVEFYRLAR